MDRLDIDRIDGKDVRAFTRNGNDWSNKYQRIIEACGSLSCSLRG
jgi:ATP-dependent DNA ligase